MGSDISKIRQKTGCNVSATSPRSLTTPFGGGSSVAPPVTENVAPRVPEKVAITAGKVIKFQSSAKWRAHLEASKAIDKLMVVNFSAKWCGPCQTIEPVFSEFASIYQDVQFIKIDVDELMSVATEYEVHVMPTFILFNKGKILDVIKGAKKDELQRKIEMYRGHA